MIHDIDKIYTALTYAGGFIDENMLFKGLYLTDKPSLYGGGETLESLIERHTEIIGKYMKDSPADVYVQNMKQCTLVKVKISIVND